MTPRLILFCLVFLFACDRVSDTPSAMAKSKNHTNHNDTPKWHKNGVRKPKPMHMFKALRGSWLTGLVNSRAVRKNNEKAAVAARKERLQKVKASFGKK